jgi:putative transposase
MNALTPITAAGDFTPPFPFRKGDAVRLGDPAGSAPRNFAFVGRHTGAGGTSRLQFVNIDTQETVFYSDAELAVMMARGHFDVTLVHSARDFPRQVTSALALTDEQEAKAARRKAYALIFLNLPEDVRNKRVYVKAQAALLARDTNEKPLSYNTIVKYAEVYLRRRHVFGDACLASPRNPGRSRPEVVDIADADARLVAEATQNGVYAAVADPKGSGQAGLHSARNYLKAHRREDLSTKLPSVRTFQRRMAEMNRFAFDSVRFGNRKARRKWSAYWERKRPEVPLEEVEVDHTTMDIRVFDENRDLLWGRPDISRSRTARQACCSASRSASNRPAMRHFSRAFGTPCIRRTCPRDRRASCTDGRSSGTPSACSSTMPFTSWARTSGTHARNSALGRSSSAPAIRGGKAPRNALTRISQTVGCIEATNQRN